MTCTIESMPDGSVRIIANYDFKGNFLEQEEQIREALNDIGRLTTEKVVEKFDADGDPLIFRGIKYYSCGQFNQTYETPYGKMEVLRFAYQSSYGGGRLIPLELNANMILNATPKFSKIATTLYSSMGATDVQKTLEINDHRSISKEYIRDLNLEVASIALSKEDNSRWCYVPPALKDVATISVGIDGTCMFLGKQDGYRQSMCGTITFYNSEGERLHTIYKGCEPEYGKSKFLFRMDQELELAKARYPEATVIGLADGAADNWNWLDERTDQQLLDFFHLSEYVGKVAMALFPKDEEEREKWLQDRLHRVKHFNKGPSDLLNELKEISQVEKKKSTVEILKKTITYMDNQLHRMKYAKAVRNNQPIGSGVTEAACKVLIKQRLCQAGMRWKTEGAAAVICLRALFITIGRWEQFWEKVMRFRVREK